MILFKIRVLGRTFKVCSFDEDNAIGKGLLLSLNARANSNNKQKLVSLLQLRRVRVNCRLLMTLGPSMSKCILS